MEQIIIDGIKSEVKEQIAMQCAPFLTGIKISNLFIVPRCHWNEVVSLFHYTGISISIVFSSEDRITSLLYRAEELEVYLNRVNVARIMKELGYQTLELEQVLQEFSLRYRSSMKKRGDFPHELGLLLGYPVADVIGFMQNRGKNYLYCGYWKVYDNLAEAIRLFDLYKKAREAMVRLIRMGTDIQSIINGNFNINTI